MRSIVVVNGASSSGRTSLVRRFQELAPVEYWKIHIDEFITCLPSEMWDRCSHTDSGWVEIGKEFNLHLAEITKRHNRIVADAFYKLPAARDHLFTLLGRERVFYVQLFCELEELERRERARGDRRTGLARSQSESVYSFSGYDLRIDSTRESIDSCANILMSSVTDSAP